MKGDRLLIYVTLLGDSKQAEWFAVCDHVDGPSDLWSDGFCSSSKTPSDVASSLTEWLKARTAAG